MSFCFSFCCCGTPTSKPHVDLNFDESASPLRIDIEVDCGIVGNSDVLCLVPAGIPSDEICTSVRSFQSIPISRSPTCESRGHSVLVLSKPQVAKVYLAYLRPHGDGARFELLGESRKFSLLTLPPPKSWSRSFVLKPEEEPVALAAVTAKAPRSRKTSAVAVIQQEFPRREASRSMAGSECSTEEWARSLLHSSRIEDQEEQDRVLKILSAHHGALTQIKASASCCQIRHENRGESERTLQKLANKGRRSAVPMKERREVLKNIANTIEEGRRVKCFSFRRKLPDCC